MKTIRKVITGLLCAMVFTVAVSNPIFYVAAADGIDVPGLTKIDNTKGRKKDEKFNFNIMWSNPYQTPTPGAADAYNQQFVYGKIDSTNAYRPTLTNDFENMKLQYNMQYLSWGGAEENADTGLLYKPYEYCDFLDYNFGTYTSFENAMNDIFPGWTKKGTHIYSAEGIDISDNANIINDQLATYGYCQPYSFSVPSIRYMRFISVINNYNWQYGMIRELKPKYEYLDAAQNSYYAIAGQPFSSDDFIVTSDFVQIGEWGQGYTVRQATYNQKNKVAFLFVNGAQSDVYMPNVLNTVICFYIPFNHPYYYPIEANCEYPTLTKNTDNLIEIMKFSFIPYSVQ